MAEAQQKQLAKRQRPPETKIPSDFCAEVGLEDRFFAVGIDDNPKEHRSTVLL